jgi:hypothetical protein
MDKLPGLKTQTCLEPLLSSLGATVVLVVLLELSFATSLKPFVAVKWCGDMLTWLVMVVTC